jgi:hypothetical protein
VLGGIKVVGGWCHSCLQNPNRSPISFGAVGIKAIAPQNYLITTNIGEVEGFGFGSGVAQFTGTGMVLGPIRWWDSVFVAGRLVSEILHGIF